MKVKCKNIIVSQASNDDLNVQKYIEKNVHLEEIDLEVGAVYLVYGIALWDGQIQYYICSENDDEYPTPYHSAFFDLIDSKIPDDWSLSFDHSASIVPSEWAEIPHFYESLIEGNPQFIEAFQSIKSRLGPSVLS